ncbi:hypothetical protein [Sorangium sp. So ce1335]
MKAAPEQIPPPPRGSLGELFNPFLPEQIEDPYPIYARAARGAGLL